MPSGVGNATCCILLKLKPLFHLTRVSTGPVLPYLTTGHALPRAGIFQTAKCLSSASCPNARPIHSTQTHNLYFIWTGTLGPWPAPVTSSVPISFATSFQYRYQYRNRFPAVTFQWRRLRAFHDIAGPWANRANSRRSSHSANGGN